MRPDDECRIQKQGLHSPLSSHIFGRESSPFLKPIICKSKWIKANQTDAKQTQNGERGTRKGARETKLFPSTYPTIQKSTHPGSRVVPRSCRVALTQLVVVQRQSWPVVLDRAWGSIRVSSRHGGTRRVYSPFLFPSTPDPRPFPTI